MTALIRSGTKPPADDISPTVPTLAIVARLVVHQLPVWVDRKTFDAAEAEMKQIRRRQGYAEIQRADLPERNFLLFGVPIICSDA